MPFDTANDIFSSFGMGVDFLTVLPEPTDTISQGDIQQLLNENRIVLFGSGIVGFIYCGKREDIEKSIDKFILDYLEGIESLRVHYFGRRRFVPPISDPWIRFDFGSLGVRSEYAHVVGRNENGQRIYGRHVEGFILIYINIHARNFTDEYRVTDTLDIIAKYFTDARHVPIFDYTGGTLAQIGTIHIINTNDTTTDDAETSGVVTRLVFVHTNYLECYLNER